MSREGRDRLRIGVGVRGMDRGVRGEGSIHSMLSSNLRVLRRLGCSHLDGCGLPSCDRKGYNRMRRRGLLDREVLWARRDVRFWISLSLLVEKHEEVERRGIS